MVFLWHLWKNLDHFPWRTSHLLLHNPQLCLESLPCRRLTWLFPHVKLKWPEGTSIHVLNWWVPQPGKLERFFHQKSQKILVPLFLWPSSWRGSLTLVLSTRLVKTEQMQGRLKSFYCPMGVERHPASMPSDLELETQNWEAFYLPKSLKRLMCGQPKN